uniref:GEM-like protein 5 n=1 Tax=Anthurium amnicola TaxID=1678845 RepID=A0A1D1ZI01_9ARAE
MEGSTGTNMEGKQQQQQPLPAAPPTTPSGAAEEKWGTRLMGPPAAPSAHPHNQRAATWTASHDDVPGPYRVEHAPVEKPSSSPMETILELFNTWSRKAETLASNVWLNLKTAPSKTEAAWGKLGLAAKAVTEGGFESLFKQTFPTDPNEKLKKTFACYLSTTTGPVAGTLYLSNVNVAFCSDRPLSFTAPSGQEAWSYYKVMIPLAKVATVNPVTMKENPTEKYIQIVTVDGHEFWLMGFVSYEKASAHLSQAVSNLAVPRPPAEPVVQG